ncbi:MAG TPA: hypothetical protein PLA20_04565 [Bacilli bacterium]|nr:hypothetical protein [Acholeplasmataceae bacterium]HOE78166.1 hypothetical protein [Bacilli bacterium]HON64281.1 hypothetical protein [Bacilli bacterium]HOR96122.1 hypothetical protein [Bacilli bacterium]HPD12200.1 hypothetical protein [Bacilli bacterium]
MSGEFLVKSVATSDTASQELLTHYYRNDYNTVKNCVLEVAKQLNYTVETVDDRFKEIFLQGAKSHIIVNMVNITYYETALDLTVYTYWTLTKKKAVQIVTDFYARCDRKLNFKGKGLTK